MMTAWNTICRASAVVVFLLGALVVNVWGQGGSSPQYGGAFKGLTKIIGTIVCAECSLDEARGAHPDLNDLYFLEHREGQVVIQVNQVLNSAGRGTGESLVGSMWEAMTWYPKITVRAKSDEFQKLMAEENLFHEVELTGLVRSTRTLDLVDVDILGAEPKYLDQV